MRKFHHFRLIALSLNLICTRNIKMSSNSKSFNTTCYFIIIYFFDNQNVIVMALHKHQHRQDAI